MAMKAGTLISLAVMVGGALVLPWFLKGPDGKPLVDKMDEVKAQALREDSTVSTEKTRQTFYKWQDANGVWQFGDSVPDGINAVPVQVDTAANIIRSEKAPVAVADPGKPAQTPVVTLIEDSQRVNPLTPITNPSKVTGLIDQAKGVQDLVTGRVESIDQATGQ
jgi:hypothetical protein